MEQTAYGLGTAVALPFEQAVARTKEALQSQGFGVLTEIDVGKTMQEKLNVDFQPYVILGACNPQLAHRALTAELEIGLPLPCNVVVHQEGKGSRVMIMDPDTALGIVHNPALRKVAAEAKARLRRVVEALQK